MSIHPLRHVDGLFTSPCLSGKDGEALGRWKTKDYWSQVCTYTALRADHYWCMPLITTAPLVDQ